MKQEYNFTAIFYIKLLKMQNSIGSWSEGSKIYYKLTNKEIAPNTLGNKVKTILFNDSRIDLLLLEEYLRQTKLLTSQGEVFEPKPNTDFTQITKLSDNSSLVKVLGIKEEDYLPIFGIDIEKDSDDTIINKINRKIGDEIFLLKYLGYDPGIFEVSKISHGAWSVVLKIEDSKNGVKTAYPRKVMNDRFSIIIKKREKPFVYISKEEMEQFLEQFLKRRLITPFDIFDFKQQVHKDDKIYNDNLLMVSPGLELHLGKLSSVIDYEDYSVKQALWRLRQATKEIFEYQQYAQCSNLLLGVGNDFFNSDTMDDKTTAGTPQHNDTRPKEVYLWGKIGFMQMIETLKHEFKKVILKGMPGNHDERSSFCLYTNLYDIYSMTGDPKVDVELSYGALRYTTSHTWGENLIVFTHGKNPEGKNLSNKSLAEAVKYQFPEQVHKAKNIYVFAGHLHQDHEVKFGNITVIRTASLSGVDAWHCANNYLGQREGHSVYLFDKNKGYVGKHNITISKSDSQKKLSGISRNPNDSVDREMRKALNLSNDKINSEIHNQQLLCIDEKEKELDNAIRKIIQLMKKNNISDSELRNKIMELIGWDLTFKSLETQKAIIKRYLER